MKITEIDLTSKDLANTITAYWKSVANEDVDQDTEGNSEALEEVRATIITLHKLDDNQENRTLSSRAVVDWLYRLGYEWKEVKKGLYKGGHERENVLEDWNQVFFLKFQELQPRMLEWDREEKLIHTVDEIWAITGERPLVVVTHDKCIFHANDGPTHVWTLKDSRPLRKKGHGQRIMPSKFITSSS